MTRAATRIGDEGRVKPDRQWEVSGQEETDGIPGSVSASRCLWIALAAARVLKTEAVARINDLNENSVPSLESSSNLRVRCGHHPQRRWIADR